MLRGARLLLAFAMHHIVSAEVAAPIHLLPATSFPKARCLDGSQGAYYHRPSSTREAATKWVFSLQGGGECITEEDCTSRATGDLGSSAGYSPDGAQFLSQFQYYDEANNPDFWDWNHVFVMYCTGDLFMGTVVTPGPEQWGWAYFSGALVVDAVVEDLKTRPDLVATLNASLSVATEVIWSGDSAGGIGAVASVDRVATAIPSAIVAAAPIAGFYWDNAWPYTGPGAVPYIPFGVQDFAGYYNLWEIVVPSACAEALPLTPWACALANYSIPYAASPVFVIEMLTDSVQLSLHSGVPEYNDDTTSYVLDFGRNMTAAVTESVIDKPQDSPNLGRTGLFAASCFSHTSFYYYGPFLADAANGANASFVSAFADWFYQREGGVSRDLEDICCESDESVIFNPTCN